MAKPLTPDEIIEALKVWGIPYVEQPGWRTRTNSGGWGDVTGFMVHHTGDDAPDSADLKIVTEGRSGLPGPLCNFGLDDTGRVILVAAGAANHAGGGDIRVLDAVRKESYGDYPPSPRYTHTDLVNGVSGAVSGNPRFYGVEPFYYRNLTKAARATMPRLAAAITWALDKKDTENTWTSKSTIGHKEWQRGKIDPALVDMKSLRSEVQALLTAGPTGSTSEEDELMALQILNPLTKKPWAAAKAFWSMWYYIVEVAQDLKKVLALLEALAKASNSMSPEEIKQVTEAAAQGAQQALDERISEAEVSLTVSSKEPTA